MGMSLGAFWTILNGASVTGETRFPVLSLLKSLKFGLVNVDFSSENRTRSPKLSSRYLANLAATNGFVSGQKPCV